MNNKLNLLHKKLFECINAQEKNWNSFIYTQAKKFYQGFDEIRCPRLATIFPFFQLWEDYFLKYHYFRMDRFLAHKDTRLQHFSR